MMKHIDANNNIFQKAPVYFNHAYLVLSDENYQAITQAKFLLNDFATCELRETQADSDEQWSGFYLRGENTYLEFFPPQSNFNLQTVGNVGLALSVDSMDEISRLKELLDDQLPGCFRRLSREKIIKGESRPWFEYLFFIHQDTVPAQLNYWIMAYYPHYLGLPRHTVAVTRGIANAKLYDKNKLLKDIVEIDFVLDSDSYDRLAVLLKLTNYKRTELQDDILQFEGNGIIFTLKYREGKKEAGIKRIKMRLNTLPEPSTVRRWNDTKLIFNPKDLTCDMVFN